MTDPWLFVYEAYVPEEEGLREALCTLGNGCFATRGAGAEASADDVHYPGCYLAGGYDRLETEIAGKVIENEDLVNLPNWLPLNFRPEGGEWFDLAKVEILAYRQELNLREGVLTREVGFKDRQGRESVLINRRLVHMGYPHLAAQRLELRPVNWSGRVEVRSALDGRVINAGVDRYKKLSSGHLEPLGTSASGDLIQLKAQTVQSELRIALSARTALFSGGRTLKAESKVAAEKAFVGRVFKVRAVQGRPLAAEKIVLSLIHI